MELLTDKRRRPTRSVGALVVLYGVERRSSKAKPPQPTWIPSYLLKEQISTGYTPSWCIWGSVDPIVSLNWLILAAKYPAI
jgi:hypothetical protein